MILVELDSATISWVTYETLPGLRLKEENRRPYFCTNIHTFRFNSLWVPTHFEQLQISVPYQGHPYVLC